VFLPFGILFLFIEELFLSDQGYSRCMHGLAECSGQVKVCGLVTLGVIYIFTYNTPIRLSNRLTLLNHVF
jgi:hypothetical protein